MRITAEKKQLTLDFEPGLTDRHRHLRDCIATSIYRRGLSTSAIDLNESPGNLTNQLSDESQRKFGVDQLETYLDKSKDYTPIYYLIEKYLHNDTSAREAALADLLPALGPVIAAMKKAGLV